MPARRPRRAPCCARWRAACDAGAAPAAKWGDAQWTLLCLALSVATCLSLTPSAQRQAELVFVRPSRADLLLPARSKDAHLSRQFRADVLDRLSAAASLHCGVGADKRSALFAHNFVLRSAGREEVVNAHAVHFCGDPGETMVDLRFDPAPGAPRVSCAEQYGLDFKEVVRPAMGFLSYALVEDGYRQVRRRPARGAAEACLAQHAVAILDSQWA